MASSLKDSGHSQWGGLSINDFFFFLQSEGKQRMEYSLMSSPDGKSGFKAVMSELLGVK